MPLEAIKTKKNRGKFICGGLYSVFMVSVIISLKTIENVIGQTLSQSLPFKASGNILFMQNDE